MLKKLISLLLTTSLSLGTISYVTIQPTEATTSRYNKRVNRARYHKRYRVRRTKNYFKLKRAIRERRLNGQVGIASHYGHNDGYHGRRTASGVKFSKYSNICAHNGFRFGTRLKVTNVKTGKFTICQVQDTGAFNRLGRSLDLSFSSFSQIANPNQGLVKVKIEKVN